MSDNILIIGGGVVGAMCAYYLSQHNSNITILDRGTFGGGCSHGNCGYICPSHVLPLTVPGTVLKTLPTAWKKSSPLYIKPRLSWDLITWLWRFQRNCNHDQMIRAGKALSALLDSSRTLFQELIGREGLACEWETKGMLFIYHTKHHLDEFDSTAKLIKDEFGKEYEKIDAEHLAQMEPALKPGLPGAWYHRGDAHLRPDRLMKELRRVLESRGVKIIENAEVTEIVREGSTTKAARTSQGSFEAKEFIVATGAWTPLLQKQLGMKIPIQPGKGYSITMPRPTKCPSYPLIFEEHRIAITPMQSGYRIGSTMEFSGYDTSLNPARLQALVDGAKHYLDEPTAEPIQESWYGWRPMTPDSLPIIDRSPLSSNLLLAVGHNMLGISTATATGKLVCELMTRQSSHVDPSPYSAKRFQ
jgi:D-amino-acid dehydrogenase